MTAQKQIFTETDPLIERVATRVRAARGALGLPRRTVSERSGVSPRYLAQLEAGEGNISILLLNRVANALNVRIDDLLREEDPLDGDVFRVAQLYRTAPPVVQGRVRALLSPENPVGLRAQRICLVGLRGAGKSTLGRAAADKLKIPFVELNQQIESQTGMPISEVMALYGVDGYRRLEAEALDAAIRTHDKMILAVSGGIVAAPDTYAQALERFHTIWIRTSPGEHMARVRAQGDVRATEEGSPSPMEQIKTLLDARRSEYKRALAQVDTSGKPEAASVNDLLSVVARLRCLDGIGTD